MACQRPTCGDYDAVPDKVAGCRDRATILTLVMTGRRRTEVIELKADDITTEGERAFYSYCGKGGKSGHREAAASSLRGDPRDAGRRRQGAGDDAARGVALAGRCR
ncbi:hypothetical protein AYO38_04655 [bacterium SCGC AG-212-C10]|nr:hypothetical protein AYO38_04655 [bacterium SCGC AG-212-C10]